MQKSQLENLLSGVDFYEEKRYNNSTTLSFMIFVKEYFRLRSIIYVCL